MIALQLCIFSNLDIGRNGNGKMQDAPVHRNRVILTLCLYAVFMSHGLNISITGPTLVHVGYLYGTDVAGMSIVYTCNALGHLTGSFLCALVFDRFNHELQLFLGTLAMGLLLMVQPWLPHLYMFYAAACMMATAAGFIDSCGQSYVIRLWTGHRFKDPTMQGIHGIWSLGAFIGPFIVSPFLVDLPVEAGRGTTVSFENITYETSSPHNNDLPVTIHGIESVRFPYLIVGAFQCLVATTYTIILCCMKSVRQQKKKNSGSTNKIVTNTGETLTFKIPMLTMEFFFFFIYAWCESIPGAYIAAFVITGLNWPVYKGPLMTSVFWGSLGLGRILGAPISIIFSLRTMIIFNIALTTIAFIVMLFSSVAPEYVLWISVAAAGLGMSTTFASVILWTSNYITITGSIGSLFVVSSAFGRMSSAPLTGFLFQNKTHMWVVYLSLFAALINVVLFPLMSVFAKCHMISIEKQNKRNEPEEADLNELPLTSQKQV